MKLLSGTKQKIVECALHILECRGIQALTQTAVAKDAGIPQGQLTYHYKKRSDLVNAVTSAVLDAMADAVFQKEFSDVVEGKELGPFLRMLLGFLKSKSRSRALFGLMLEADESPEIKERLMAQGTQVRGLIATVCRLDEEDPHISLVHSLLLGYGLQYFLVDDKTIRARLDKDFEANFRSLLSLIPKRPGQKKKGE